MKNTILFDLDGTLLDTLTDLTMAVNYALGRVGLPAKQSSEVASYLGDGYKVLMQRACDGDEKKADESYPYFTEYYSAHLEDNTKPYAGVVDCLKTLWQKGRKMAIVSNKGDEAVKILCGKFFTPYVTEFFGVTDTLPKKPAPDMLNLAIKTLRSDKSDCIMVGDGEADLEMAKRAGIEAVSVTWGFRKEEFLREQGAKTFLRVVEELKNL
ncbi:MAG: HAD family hydrolase [Clostridia bacterium]|nr:HAD family hydrolase [Clostridia bacterium]